MEPNSPPARCNWGRRSRRTSGRCSQPPPPRGPSRAWQGIVCRPTGARSAAQPPYTLSAGRSPLDVCVVLRTSARGWRRLVSSLRRVWSRSVATRPMLDAVRRRRKQDHRPPETARAPISSGCIRGRRHEGMYGMAEVSCGVSKIVSDTNRSAGRSGSWEGKTARANAGVL